MNEITRMCNKIGSEIVRYNCFFPSYLDSNEPGAGLYFLLV